MRLMAYFKLRRVVAIIWCFVCFRLSFLAVFYYMERLQCVRLY